MLLKNSSFGVKQQSLTHNPLVVLAHAYDSLMII
jgi:hypothetical protein